MSDKIEGVPEGWRLVAIRRVKNGEWFIERSGRIELWREPDDETSCWVHPVIQKIEKTKQYRPFKNAAEFAPYRNRWWRYMDDHQTVSRPPANYSDSGHYGYDFEYGLERKVFDDGSPFGVEVTE